MKSRDCINTISKTFQYEAGRKYYAHKIAGSTYVALYRQTGEEKYQKKAVDELTKALDY